MRNAPVSHTKDSRQSTQEKSAQNRKIEGKKSLIQADFQPSHFEGQGVDTFSLFFFTSKRPRALGKEVFYAGY